MLALVKDGLVDKYPVTLADLQERHPGVSFSLPLRIEDLTDYSVTEIAVLPHPAHDPETERIIQREPEQINGQWVIGFDVVPIPQDELDQINETKRLAREADIRERRNALLRDSDWTQLPTGPLSDATKATWEEYRQALRDITDQPDFPWDVIWPTPPE